MIRPLRVVALDLSIRGTGIAVTHDQVGEPRLSCRTITPRKRDSPTRMDHERLHEVIGAVMATVACKPDLVVIEEPIAVAKGDTSIRLAELHGPIKHWLWSKRIPYVDVHLTKVKTYATGKGGGDGTQKPDILAAIIAQYGRWLHIHTDDEADAVSMLAMALDAYGQPLADLGERHTRALAGITWPTLDLTRSA